MRGLIVFVPLPVEENVRGDDRGSRSRLRVDKAPEPPGKDVAKVGLAVVAALLVRLRMACQLPYVRRTLQAGKSSAI